jgi:hypothetical protein
VLNAYVALVVQNREVVALEIARKGIEPRIIERNVRGGTAERMYQGVVFLERRLVSPRDCAPCDAVCRTLTRYSGPRRIASCIRVR